ncbi:hypothetical protein [Thermomonospora cellulosilytica]|uniref:Helix-turn-helix domain-containing protein n=1 Tax=Thermomonospora cellulosilytica TaxID=1411118 RepID=A0A7W3N1U9_9ACTN|nr:hypothetical protein [Thermomonospora cellulosilytica]MBA9005990.1 hypothetical protein [Thermomonospora cellulosilytica]
MQEPESAGQPGQAELDAPGITPLGRFEWERAIRRVRLGFYDSPRQDPKRWVRHATVQQVALVIATYGDLDGSRVFPSAERVARVCELDVRTVETCLRRLRALHLLQMVRPRRSPGRRGGPGRPAEYRLTAPTDLLERVAYLDPEEKLLVVPPGAVTGPARKPRARRQPRQEQEQLWTAGETPPE